MQSKFMDLKRRRCGVALMKKLVHLYEVRANALCLCICMGGGGGGIEAILVAACKHKSLQPFHFIFELL